MAQWVAFRPIFEVYAGKKGYKRGECRREDWWRQEATEKQLLETLERVLREAKRKILQVERVIQVDPEEGCDAEREDEMLGWRQETPGWANDLVR